MKIILKEDHGILGSAGDVVEVKGGYARNYLIPRGIGKVANASNIKAMEELRRQQHKKINKEIEEAKKLAGELEKVSLTLTVKTGEDNKVFGSVTSQNIADALQEKGFEAIDKRKILLAHPLKELGEFPVKIKVYGEVMAEISVKVESSTGGEDTGEPKKEDIKSEEVSIEDSSEESPEQKAEETTEQIPEEQSINRDKQGGEDQAETEENPEEKQ